MKLSSKMERCGLSPMRKFNPYAAAAAERGIKIYHLNIGQPDIKTPDIFYKAISDFHDPVLSYAPSGGIPKLLDAVRGYYKRIGVELERSQILPTTGGSEALQMIMATILDDGDEIIIPEPFYPNYHTSVALAGATIHPVPADPKRGYAYADRAALESAINEHTRVIMITNPGNPTGAVLSRDELKLMLDVTKTMSDDEIRAEINEIAGRYNVRLTDTQVNQLLTLCRSLEGLDGEALKARVEDVQSTLQKVSDAKNKVVGFVEGVKKVVDSVSGFFDKIKDIIARF